MFIVTPSSPFTTGKRQKRVFTHLTRSVLRRQLLNVRLCIFHGEPRENGIRANLLLSPDIFAIYSRSNYEHAFRSPTLLIRKLRNHAERLGAPGARCAARLGLRSSSIRIPVPGPLSRALARPGRLTDKLRRREVSLFSTEWMMFW